MKRRNLISIRRIDNFTQTDRERERETYRGDAAAEDDVLEVLLRRHANPATRRGKSTERRGRSLSDESDGKEGDETRRGAGGRKLRPSAHLLYPSFPIGRLPPH